VATTVLAACTVAGLLVVPRVPGLRRVPGPLLALVVGTVLQALFHFDGMRTIGDAFGRLPQGLPPLSVPAFGDVPLGELVGPAFAIALLGAIESLLSATVADGMGGTRHDPNQELVGQGLANLLTPWFGGFAATGAIARTATNLRNGATGPLSGLVHSAVLLIVLVVFAPLASAVPLATLAAILCVVAWHMSDTHEVMRLLQRAPRADAAILAVTFALTLFTDLVVAVNIGVILALLQFLRRMADSVEVRRLRPGEPDAGEASAVPDEYATESDPDRDALATPGALPPGVQVYSVDGPLFFAAVEAFEQAMGVVHGDPRTLVIRLRWVPFADATGLQALEEAVERFQHRGVRVMLVGANPRVRGKLERLGLAERLGAANLHDTLAQALEACRAPVREAPASTG
jgi:SulP family sulfate permease